MFSLIPRMILHIWELEINILIFKHDVVIIKDLFDKCKFLSKNKNELN